MPQRVPGPPIDALADHPDGRWGPFASVPLARQAPGYFAVVDRGESEIFDLLREHFEGAVLVEVRWDARRGERRAARMDDALDEPDFRLCLEACPRCRAAKYGSGACHLPRGHSGPHECNGVSGVLHQWR